MDVQANIIVHGIVQGVGFRPFIYRTATSLSLRGYVKNRGDAVVEIVLQGPNSSIKLFLDTLKLSPPPAARVDSVQVTYLTPREIFQDFAIHYSTDEKRHRGSTIPADIAICHACISELMDRKNRRFGYFFITCTDCGPRFTIIRKTPYDRANTSMNLFTPCVECHREYTDSKDRRFHAQTVACPKCGPCASLVDRYGRSVVERSPIQTSGKLISEGLIIAVKGYGGFHIAASALRSKPIRKLRQVKHRSQKPFAVMAQDLQAVKKFAEVNRAEEALLISRQRPILLLKKKRTSPLSELISPGLSTVGVMLPYTGLHLLLFEEVSDPAFIMTSANMPSEPIIKDNDLAFDKLGEVVDYFLIHDREIVHRCDDSVLKIIGNDTAFIRRSRGYAPEPLTLKASSIRAVAGIGSELNNTACLLVDNKAFLTQHIGDVETPETLTFLKESINHLANLTNSPIEAIACDLHPSFNTSRLAVKISTSLNIPLLKIQHHYAHASKLLAEHGLEEIVAITCDGFGYGLDGKAWGGEIIYATKSGFRRLGHLEEHPLIGGNLAAYYPARILAPILEGEAGFEQWIRERAHLFPHGLAEAERILYDAHRVRGVMTSSCGRLLDAVSALLDICFERTYEGEPAMKLEAAAEGGRDILSLSAERRNETIPTSQLLQELFSMRNRYPKRDLAFSAQSYIAKALAEFAVEEADREGVKDVGFTGGVAYNSHIAHKIREIVERAGLNFRINRWLPCGDGGIALGQAFYAAHILQSS